MSQTARKNKHSNDNTKFYVSPTDRLDLVFAVTKEQAQGKSLIQVDVLVMLALVGHRNNKTGRCDPSYPTIAAEIGVSVSTVERSIERLDKGGWLNKIHRSYKGGLKRSNQHILHFDRGEPWVTQDDDIEDSSTNDGTDPSHMQGPSRHQCGDGGVTGDGTDPSPVTDKLSEENPVNEPSEENPFPTSDADRNARGADLCRGHTSGRLEPANDNRSLDDMVGQLCAVYPAEGVTERPMTGPFIPSYRTTMRDLLGRALNDGARFQEDVMNAAKSYRRYIDAWAGERAVKPLTAFLQYSAWESRRWEQDMPPAGHKPASAKPWPSDWRDPFWRAFPARKNVPEAERELEKISKSGKVAFEAIESAARQHGRDISDPKYAKNPVLWLKDEPWKSVRRSSPDYRSRMNAAI